MVIFDVDVEGTSGKRGRVTVCVLRGLDGCDNLARTFRWSS
jgi:hypothetical protein